MTPRTLAAFAAGALVGSLMQAVYDTRGETAQRGRAVLPENRDVASAFAKSLVGEMRRHEKLSDDHEKRIAQLEEERVTIGGRVAAGLREARSDRRIANRVRQVTDDRSQSLKVARESDEDALEVRLVCRPVAVRDAVVQLLRVLSDSDDARLKVVHDHSPSSMGATSEGNGAGGSQTSPPAPTSGARP